ncbi:Nin1 binding protein [Blyttiomyces sp. JEL0837]|nr:Nin1 binding protein [Blyttiomyces sp. JEL0837]
MKVLVVVSVNGVHGFASDWDNFALGLSAQFNELIPTKIKDSNIDSNVRFFHMSSQASQGFQTHHGLIVMGERLATEIVEWMKKIVFTSLPQDQKHDIYFSIVGHSLGGLIARSALKLLVSTNPSDSTKSIFQLCQSNSTIIQSFNPLSYISISTPHLGSRRAKPKETKDNARWGKLLWVGLLSTVASYGFGLSGKEMMLLDWPPASVSKDEITNGSLSRRSPGSVLKVVNGVENDHDDRDVEYDEMEASSQNGKNAPILFEMARVDGPYIAAIKQFKCTLVSAVEGDTIVSYSSSAISSANPHGTVIPVDTALRILSVSGFTDFDDEEGSATRKLETDSLLFNATDKTPAWVASILGDKPLDLGKRVKGTRHHEGEPYPEPIVADSPKSPTRSTGSFSISKQTSILDSPMAINSVESPTTMDDVKQSEPISQSTDNITKSSSQFSFGAWVPDTTHDVLFSTTLMTELLKTAHSWRRINMHVSIPQAVHRNSGHALIVGKPMPMIPSKIRDMAAMSGYFIARIFTIDKLPLFQLSFDKSKMTAKPQGKVKVLVVDTAPLLKNIRLDQLADQIYTVAEVLAEVRDENSRKNLAMLMPLYDIKTKVPSDEALAAVVKFSKKTGDYATLSATDLKVLALTWMLEKEYASQPAVQQEETQIVQEEVEEVEEDDESIDEDAAVEQEQDIVVEEAEPTAKTEEPAQPEEDDGEGEWITPSNLSKMNAKLLGQDKSKVTIDLNVKVACMTSDFAMQNVLLQMNLRILSADGLLITRLKSWVLRCHACYKTTSILDKKFCDSCGNNTLIRTSVSVDANGKMKIHLKKNFQYNNRGTKYSIPTPQGGKKSSDIILREDQKEYARALKDEKARKKKDLDDIDTILLAGSSEKKGAKVTIGFGRKNPNEVRGRRR